MLAERLDNDWEPPDEETGWEGVGEWTWNAPGWGDLAEAVEGRRHNPWDTGIGTAGGGDFIFIGGLAGLQIQWQFVERTDYPPEEGGGWSVRQVDRGVLIHLVEPRPGCDDDAGGEAWGVEALGIGSVPRDFDDEPGEYPESTGGWAWSRFTPEYGFGFPPDLDFYASYARGMELIGEEVGIDRRPKWDVKVTPVAWF